MRLLAFLEPPVVFLVALALLIVSIVCMSIGADAQHIVGPISDCSGSIGPSPANIVFPSSGLGGNAPQDYLLIQNNSPANQIIWINVLGGTATLGPPSIQLAPTASVSYSSTTYPLPKLPVSIIASSSGAVYTCHYK